MSLFRLANSPRAVLRKASGAGAAAVALGLACGLAATAWSQEPTAPTTFFEAIEVNVVNVDVIVTDRDGEPVHGLQAADFEVLEDGEPMAITNFSEIRGGHVAPATDGGEETVSEPVRQNLTMVIFVDNHHITPQHRNRLLTGIGTFLEEGIGDDDRVMVATYDDTLEIHQPLTSDLAAVRSAFDEIAKSNTRGVQAAADFRRLLSEISRVDLHTVDEGVYDLETLIQQARAVLSGIRLYSEARYQDIARAADAMRYLVGSLAALDGRKAVLYLSDGLSVRPGEALFEAWQNRFADLDSSLSGLSGAGEILRLDAQAMIEQVAQEASGERVTFYAIASDGAASALSSLSPGLDSSMSPTWTPAMESLELANLSTSMTLLAGATGGVAGRSTGHLESVLSHLRTDFLNYYSLAFTPPHARDGQRHRLQVRLRDERLRARYREAYREKTAEERLTDLTRSTLLLEISDNPLGVDLGFGREEQKPDGNYRVPIIVKIPMSQLVLLPHERFHEGQVSIFVAAKDEKGRTSPVQSIPVPIRIPNENLLSVLGQTGGYNLLLLMRPGPHQVAVTVRDELGKVESAVSKSYTPGRLVVRMN